MGDLNGAFRRMRKAGLLARQHFKCCQTCAGAALAVEIDQKGLNPKGSVFYTKQDSSDLPQAQRRYAKYGGKAPGLYLAYGPVHVNGKGTVGLSTVEVGKLVVEALRAEGLSYQWSGDDNERIWVTLTGE